MQLQDQKMVTIESVTTLLRATSRAKRPWQAKGISVIPKGPKHERGNEWFQKNGW